MTSGTDASRTHSQGLAPLAQLFSLCQRHRLPLSLLAIQFKELPAIGRQLGGERLRQLQRQLAQAVERRIRAEDGLVAWQRGYLVLCLPGTRVEGAVCLGQRLRGWFERTRFTLDERALRLHPCMAVHVSESDQEEESREPVRELLMDTLCLLAAEEDGGEPILSRRARAALERFAATAGTEPAAASGELHELVEKLSRHDEGILVRELSPALRRLDEPTRMRLIDHLLEASLIPGATPS
ncbi:hypothetical protein ACLD02_08460 [Alloalcanivorax sp. C16-2]|uniref:hypothetical protein n=1 Tax=Alloalcanivorax sp. C16-2 TaxID=3390052 RepID=UPI0039710FF3